MSEPDVDQLHVELLRAVLARDNGRLRHPVTTSIVITAARLAELMLAGLVEDHAGDLSVIASGNPPVNDEFFDKVVAADGYPWMRIFWRTGLEPHEVLLAAISDLVANGVWRVSSHRRSSPERRSYRDDSYTAVGTDDPFRERLAENASRAVLHSLYLIQGPTLSRPVAFDNDPSLFLTRAMPTDSRVRSSLAVLLRAAHYAERHARSLLNVKSIPYVGG